MRVFLCHAVSIRRSFHCIGRLSETKSVHYAGIVERKERESDCQTGGDV